MAKGLSEAEDAVAMGVASVTADMPERVRAGIVEGSDTAFRYGVHMVAGAVRVLGSLAAVAGIRHLCAVVSGCR
ncbi:hypothetical protein QLQ12_20865 [Actinoplanes sp. NEAU-A12]|uniref:Uncharacterized protein n=1 Tax=Actinoplanes sandaracinus TaxID=3045177 RepID=A0ABT6WMW4_9ACTN|nr:hypothetical protein [Actinoplanes sandaracinus]MDI6101069.1 hypothetical protein [Actinoplanes sandaracinus]